MSDKYYKKADALLAPFDGPDYDDFHKAIADALRESAIEAYEDAAESLYCRDRAICGGECRAKNGPCSDCLAAARLEGIAAGIRAAGENK